MTLGDLIRCPCGAQNLLLLMVAQLALCAVLAQAGSRLSSPSPLPLRSRPVKKARVLSRAGLSFLSQRHLTIVALIGAVSAAAVTIVDFQFKLSAAAVLDENDLAGYFGRFYGICGGVALAVQIWVTGRVLERYGILAIRVLPDVAVDALRVTDFGQKDDDGRGTAMSGKPSTGKRPKTIIDAVVDAFIAPT